MLCTRPYWWGKRVFESEKYCRVGGEKGAHQLRELYLRVKSVQMDEKGRKLYEIEMRTESCPQEWAK